MQNLNCCYLVDDLLPAFTMDASLIQQRLRKSRGQALVAAQDLNLQPQLSRLFFQRRHKTLHRLCCSPGPTVEFQWHSDHASQLAVSCQLKDLGDGISGRNGGMWQRETTLVV